MNQQPQTADESANREVNPGANPWHRRSRYFNSGNAFAMSLPPVPSVQFTNERDRAFADSAATGLIDMNLSRELNTPFPATTPFALSRYLCIRAGDTIAPQFNASAVVVCILEGSGSSRQMDTGTAIDWKRGDILLLPGNQVFEHRATEHTVAWLVTDEPVLNFMQLSIHADDDLAVPEPIYYPAEDLDRELDAVYAHPDAAKFAGLAVVLSHDKLEHTRNIHPTLTLALNSLAPNTAQRPHVHNSMALTLCIDGEDCFSTIDGQRKDWQHHAVMVTPPGAVHSHHNEGKKRMRCLIVQDGALYYHGRTMGFSFAEHPDNQTTS
jgi:gentisate 1,2-dioxygenase